MLLTIAASERSRGYYGWRLLLCLAMAQVVSWGVLYYSFAVFMQPIEAEMGWTRAQVSGAFSLALLASAAASIPVGHWLDSRGGRGLMTVGGIGGCMLLLALSRVASLPAFYAIWVGLGVVMAMVLYEPAFAVVATWFVRDRDRALTILTLVAGLASTLVVPLASWLLEARGWRSAVATLAILLGITTVPLHALVLRRNPAAVGQCPDGDPRSELPPEHASVDGAIRPVLTEPRFWSLTLAFAISSLVSVAATVHLIPYLTGQHYSPVVAGSILGAIGLMQLPGRVAFGAVHQALGWRLSVMAVLLAQAAAITLLTLSPGFVSLAAFVCLFGMGNGMTTLLRASTVADLYGRARYGRVNGVMATLGTCGRAAGPFVAALALAAQGSYPLVFGTLALLLGLAALLVMLPWRLRPFDSAAPVASAR